MEFEQDEPEYFPGEVGNDPHVRSKYALSHIWHEWDGMQDFVAKMKAKEEAGEIPYPRGAGANAVAEYVEAAQSYRSQLSHIPYTPKEADEWCAPSKMPRICAPSNLQYAHGCRWIQVGQVDGGAPGKLLAPGEHQGAGGGQDAGGGELPPVLIHYIIKALMNGRKR